MVIGKFSFEKGLIFLVGGVVIIGIILGIFIYSSYIKSELTLLAPVGGEKIEIGQTYKIKWKSQGISSVGIAVYKEKDAKWIVKNVPASSGEYDWDIYPGQEYGSGFWIAIFEYPWKAGNKVAYTRVPVNIVYSQSSACDSFSLQNDWLFFPSDYPDLRRVFVTKNYYSGNLGGLAGADKICQKEANDFGFSGNWQAFLGGDAAGESALERLNSGPRKSDGVFVSASVAGTLLNGLTCHRFLGQGFNSVLNRFLNPIAVVKNQADSAFMESLSNVWLGRIDAASRNNCTPIQLYLAYSGGKTLREKYSYTVTCQEWSQEKDAVPNSASVDSSSLPSCYTSEGKYTNAAGLAGLSSTKGDPNASYLIYSQGDPCSAQKKLICVEE